MKSSQFKNTIFTYFHDSDPSRRPIEKRTYKASEVPAGYGAFFSVNGFADGVRQKTHLTNVNAVHVDIDHTDATWDEILMEMAEYALPTFVNETKNGFHCFWMFEEPLFVNDNDREIVTATIEGINKKLIELFHGDQAASDVTRVLRIPGTEHRKDPKNPFIIKTVYEEEENKYTFDELVKIFPPAVKEEQPIVTGTLSGDKEQRLKMMLAKTHIARLYNGDTSDYDDDISKADSALCFHLAFWFEKDPTIMEQVWLQSPLGQREKTQNRKDYRDRTIEHAIGGTDNVYTKREARGQVEQDPDDLCPERTAYLNWLDVPKEEGWEKTRKILETDYLNNLHKWLAHEYPHLLFEIGEDKSYWNYDEEEGTYKPLQFPSVRSLVLGLLIDDGLTGKATEYAAKNTLNKYRTVYHERGASFDSFTYDDTWLHLKNGWLNRETLEFQDHTPDRLSLYKMEVTYDPEAKCPLYDQFLDKDSQMPEDQVRVIDQYSGYMLTNSIRAQQMLIFEGRPGCGKSMLPEIWMEVLGQKATTKNLASLDSGKIRFIGESLAHKTLCWFDEANPKTSNINEFFMGLITNKVLEIERKGINSIDNVRNTLKLVMSLNELPDHMPEGMNRRYRHIVFNRSFTDDGTVDPFYQKKIIESELPGVLNRMLRGLKDFEKMGGLTSIAGEEERKQNYTLAADDLSSFVFDHFDPTTDGIAYHTCREVRDAFAAEYPKGYNKSLSIQMFNKKMRSIRLPQFKHVYSKKSSGEVKFVGIRLKEGRSFPTDKYSPILQEGETEEGRHF